MAIQKNRYADVPEDSQITAAAAEFNDQTRYADLPSEALAIGRRCVLDGIGLLAAGLDHETTILLAQAAADQGGREDALLPGHGDKMVPAAMAARVLGDYLKREYGDKTYYYVTADYTWGHTTEASMRELTGTTDERRHGSVLVPFPGGRYHEIEEAMQAAADSDADVLVMVLFGEQMVRGMTIAQQKKLPERMQIVVPNLTLSMVEQTGPFIMAGVIGAAPWTWNVPFEYGFERGQQFVEEFSQRYRTRPSTSAASAYSIVYQWKDAVERAGSFASGNVRRALEGHSYTLLKDEQQWRAFDHQNVQSVYAVRIKARDQVMKDEYRQNFFEIISRMSGEDAAITRSQWLAERRRAGMPEQLE